MLACLTLFYEFIFIDSLLGFCLLCSYFYSSVYIFTDIYIMIITPMLLSIDIIRCWILDAPHRSNTCMHPNCIAHKPVEVVAMDCL